MCIAISKPAGLIVPERTLRHCWNCNPDGAGYMWSCFSKLHICKGLMTFDAFWRSYQDHQQDPCVLHFRIATSGGVNPQNTHPFQIHEDLAMAHNGMLDIEVPHNSALCDTALFVRDYLQKMPNNFLTYPGIVKFIDNFAQQGFMRNKLVFLDNRGISTIIGEQYGIVRDGIWYSNDSFEDSGPIDVRSDRQSFSSSSSSHAVIDDEEDSEIEAVCPYCLDLLAVYDTQCEHCSHSFAHPSYLCRSCDSTYEDIDDMDPMTGCCWTCMDYMSSKNNPR